MARKTTSAKESQDRGIVAYGAYIPYWSLERSQIGSTLSVNSPKGERRVASFDEDTTTMGVAAAKIALAQSSESISSLWFSTAEPAYLEKTNATVIHSALRLDRSVSAYDFGGASRSGVGALKVGLESAQNLVILSGLRTGMPASQDEALGGDGAAAFLTGSGDSVIAQYVGGASATQEFLDRWRDVSQPFAQQWEERFAEQIYTELFETALAETIESTGIKVTDFTKVAVVGTHPRSVKKATKAFTTEQLADDLISNVGNTGAAHAGLVLCQMLDDAKPDQLLAVVCLTDGVEILVFRTTKNLKASNKPLSTQLGKFQHVDYATFLRWRKVLKVQPPNRPEPPRISAPAALRSSDWKHGFVGSRGDSTNTLHLPPAEVSIKAGDTGQMLEAPMADVLAKIVTYTVDRLVYSESPPVIFAIINFESGGRFAVELTDVVESELEMDMPVEMTFRKLYTAEGIHNYFYKARPIR